MNLFLTLAFLFFMGSMIGWVIELIYRRFFSSANPERKWINPGFCTGPYLPLYGCGLCVLFLIASLENFHVIGNPVLEKIALFAAMALLMTAIEYLAGLLCLKLAGLRLWDYTDEWANLNGLICPKFSFYWAVLGALYYFLIHPHILNALRWLSENLAFSFFVGVFFGVFAIDAASAMQLGVKLRKFAKENGVVIKYETLKAHFRIAEEKTKKKVRFFRPFHSTHSVFDYLQRRRAELKIVEKERSQELREFREFHGRRFPAELVLLKRRGSRKERQERAAGEADTERESAREKNRKNR